MDPIPSLAPTRAANGGSRYVEARVGHAGSAKTSAGVPSRRIRPEPITTTRSKVSATKRMSWLTAMTVRPASDNSATTRWIRATPRASWPVVGSSSTTIGVFMARTEASARSFRRE